MKLSSLPLPLILFILILSTILSENISATDDNQSLAEGFFYNEQYGKALSNYLKVLEDDETNPEILYRAGLCYFMVGEYEYALQFWAFAQELNSSIFEGRTFHIPGDSMEPTITKGDMIIIDQEYFEHKEILRGDVVLFLFPKDPNIVWIRRVIGLPGDKVSIQNKKVFINGKKLADESFTIFTSSVSLPGSISPKDNLDPVQVPPGQYFVLGDNRDNSSDSRFWGFVKQEFIVGKALVIYGTSSTGYSFDDFSGERIGTIIR